MVSFLTFTLAALLASFAGVAVGARRAGGDRPAKSAIIGLLAGALGVERGEEEAHEALANGLLYAVRTKNMKVRSPRRLMADYTRRRYRSAIAIYVSRRGARKLQISMVWEQSSHTANIAAIVFS